MMMKKTAFNVLYMKCNDADFSIINLFHTLKDKNILTKQNHLLQVVNIYLGKLFTTSNLCIDVIFIATTTGANT